mmetsp:Transcript_23877/g.36286  ORF Transcript_23877/g.36286 Transcript_23877/m.36286 type:complete len:122 (+) Transcript_23877:964-1329(+)
MERFGDNKALDNEVTKGSFFPRKLYIMLSDADQFGIGSDMIKWSEEGDAFAIFDPVKFARVILPKCFQTDKFSSFQRQLHAYSFKRTHLHGFKQPPNDLHVYKHSAFRRDCPELLEEKNEK